MKAGIITAAGKAPVYGDFNDPVASEGRELVTVSLALTAHAPHTLHINIAYTPTHGTRQTLHTSTKH